MGTFRIAFEIGDPLGQRWQAVEALVDTGASYTWVPAGTLAKLGVRPQFRREFVTADNRVIERDMAVTMARWDGQSLPTLVVFGEEGSLPLLGAYTLEGFGLAPDPINRKLIRVRALAVRAEQGRIIPGFRAPGSGHEQNKCNMVQPGHAEGMTRAPCNLRKPSLSSCPDEVVPFGVVKLPG